LKDRRKRREVDDKGRIRGKKERAE